VTHCLIFLPSVFQSPIIFTKILISSLLILRIIRFDYTTTRPLRKHFVINLCSIAYLTAEIEFVWPNFKSKTVHKIIEYLTL